MQKINKIKNLNDYEFVDACGQTVNQNIGKHHLLTPGTYMQVCIFNL